VWSDRPRDSVVTCRVFGEEVGVPVMCISLDATDLLCLLCAEVLILLQDMDRRVQSI
jgi:hypothetical protein